LPGTDPHVADEDVFQREGLAIGTGHGHLERPAGFDRVELDHPLPIAVRDRRLRLPREGDDDSFPRRRRPPDRHRHAALEDHRIAKHARQFHIRADDTRDESTTESDHRQKRLDLHRKRV
jgi:hypothetical protein